MPPVGWEGGGDDDDDGVEVGEGTHGGDAIGGGGRGGGGGGGAKGVGATGGGASTGSVGRASAAALTAGKNHLERLMLLARGSPWHPSPPSERPLPSGDVKSARSIKEPADGAVAAAPAHRLPSGTAPSSAAQSVHSHSPAGRRAAGAPPPTPPPSGAV